MTALRLVVVGGGRVSSAVHLPLLRLMPETFTTVAVVDTDERRRDALAGEFPGLRVCAALDEAARLGVDAVLCATPWPTHAEVVRQALDLGLPVLCEKPVTLDLAELTKLADDERRSGGSVSVGYMKRHDPVVTRFVDLVAAGLDGLRLLQVTITDPNAPHQARHRLVAPVHPRPETRLAADRLVCGIVDPAYTPADRYAFAHGLGGSLVHQINLVHAAFEGTELRLRGRLTHAHHWADGTAVACAWRPSADAVVQMSHIRVPRHQHYAEKVEAVTEDRTLTLRLPSPYLLDQPATLHERAANLDERSWTSPPGRHGFVRQLRAWAAAIRDDGPALPGLAGASQDLHVVLEAANAAAGLGNGETA